MTDQLDQLTDAQLSETFAVEVAGWQLSDGDHPLYGPFKYRVPDDGVGYELPKFATSADAVLPFLEKRDTLLDFAVNKIEPRWAWVISVYHAEGQADGEADTFPRAACLALIRAARAEKGGGK